jgi:HEAT repeat protein
MVLEAIVASGDVGAVPELLCIALEHAGSQRAACVEAAWALAAPLLPGGLPELDEWLRRAGPWSGFWEGGWKRLTPREVTALPLASSADHILVCLLASHPNGHVREAAVIRLASSTDGEEIPFLLVRANDWVPAIRLRARSALLERITPANAGRLLRPLPLLDRLARATREDQQDIVEAVETVLQSDPARPVLLGGLGSTDFHVRRRCFRLAARALAETTPWLLDTARRDPDVVIRRWAYGRAQDLSATGDRDRYFEQAAADPFVPIRRIALEHWKRRDGPTADRVAEAFLFDRAADLRADAQRWWQARVTAPVAEIYRRTIREGTSSRLVGALNGLAETGAAEDGELTRPYLEHSRARVRRAALRALCRLAPSYTVAPFVEALFRDRSSVATEACRCLQGRTSELDLPGLWSLALGEPAVVRVRLLRLVRSVGKWQRLEFLLIAAIDPHSTVRTVALQELEDWRAGFNRSFATPSDGHLDTLRHLVERSRSVLPADLTRQIEFLIRVA